MLKRNIHFYNGVKIEFKGANIFNPQKRIVNSHYNIMSDIERTELLCKKSNVLTVLVESIPSLLAFKYEKRNPYGMLDIYICYLEEGDILKRIDGCFDPVSVIDFCRENNLKIDSDSLNYICKKYIGPNNETELVLPADTIEYII